MEKQTRKEEILKEIEGLKELLNEDQKDFVNAYMTKDVWFIDGDINKPQCMSKLTSLTSLEDVIEKVGTCGWYDEVYNNLCEDNKLEKLNELIEELEDLEDEE